MGSIRYSVAISALAIAIVATSGCGSAHSSSATSTPRTTQPRASTTSTTRPGFNLPDAGLIVAFIPSGFTAVHTPAGRAIPGHVNGPAPGWTLDGQQFWNPRTRQGFTVSVGRGTPLNLVITPDGHYAAAAHRVNGCRTYVRTLPLATPEREFTWVLGPTTTGFVGGFGMTDAELLRIADSMTVTA